MTKEDLQTGMCVELQDGTKCLFTNDSRFYNLNDGYWHISLNDYNDDLTTDEHEYDVVKVYRDYTFSMPIWERSNPKVDKLRQIRCMLDEIIEEMN